MANRNLNAAKTAKNDEFYTQFYDIEMELQHYWQHFQGKTVLYNCDAPYESNGKSNTTSVPSANQNSPLSRWRRPHNPLARRRQNRRGQLPNAM